MNAKGDILQQDFLNLELILVTHGSSVAFSLVRTESKML